jgi:hypothetical protein
MTVIAFDGRTLAADKRATVSGHTYTISKIARVGDCLVGVAGRGDKIREFQQWIANGRERDEYPKRSDEAWFTGLVVRPDGVIERFEDQSIPILVEDRTHAIGTGRDYARVAMHLGKTAREAVEIACLFDENCGNGIDTLELCELPTTSIGVA